VRNLWVDLIAIVFLIDYFPSLLLYTNKINSLKSKKQAKRFHTEKLLLKLAGDEYLRGTVV